MQPQFVSINVQLQDSPQQMHEAIEVSLQQWGDPLRWAVMEVDVVEQIASVEAIVLVSPTSPAPDSALNP
jgi:hypothetical protein